ncbi:hypothetical protein EG68_09713 [Paragonimus skrjabini miyazakii]|uniref:Uncharacterized protein n=1 Tax=Paragonimus skrjabini miyazakii TaxID=59628 RepID=A0A8S9YHH8_9TREM|nr:hypothetical protein EG68_09713 [Paragonimus skrjabini miyazakii]
MSLALAYIVSNRDARFLTDYYNYDNAWPPVAEHNLVRPVPLQLSRVDPSGSDEDQLCTRLTSLKQKCDRVSQLKEQIEHKKALWKKIHDRLSKLISTSESSFSIRCDLDEFKKHLDSRKQTAQARLDRIKRTLESAQFKRQQSIFRLEQLDKENPKKDNALQANENQNNYLQKWNLQRLGSLRETPEDYRFMLHLEAGTMDSLSERLVALVRGVKHRDRFGRLMLSHLEVVSTQHNDTGTLVQCATASFAPSAMIASLLFSLHVDRCLRTDMVRLRSQYALDWDPGKRHLHLLTGLHGDMLATLSVTPNGTFSLINIQHKQSWEHSKNYTKDDERAELGLTEHTLLSNLDSFTPPMSRSLDEWLSEVHDFCVSLSTVYP